jgi:spermidine/putrescine transport system permease protein
LRKLSASKYIFPVYATLALLFLLIPIIYTLVFSFNQANRRNTVWQGFTLDNWLNPCARQDLCDAVGTSLLIAFVSTFIATVLGTALAIALVRYNFKARSAVSLSLFLPMATPEIVMGAGLASLFFSVGIERGFLTVILAHVMFCLSFVVTTVKARVQMLDPTLEEAASDLYATPQQVFWKVTFPLLVPGIMAAALLSFALSFDDFIITYFNAGNVTTFPLFIYVAAKGGLPPQANVIASSVFLLAILIVVATQVYGNIKRKRLALTK